MLPFWSSPGTRRPTGKFSQFRIPRKRVNLLHANPIHMNAHRDTDVLHGAEAQYLGGDKETSTCRQGNTDEGRVWLQPSREERL